MIDPAIISVIRGGATKLYLDSCGSYYFARNLVWGREAFLDWSETLEEVSEFDEEASAGAVVDCDANALLWYCENDSLTNPRSIELLDELIRAAWGDDEVIYADGVADLRIASGDSVRQLDGLVEATRLESGDPLEDRLDSLEESARESDDPDFIDEDERFAWVTVVDPNQSLHHFHLNELPLDLIRNTGDSLQRLLLMPEGEVPDEINVSEGLWIDVPNQEIRVWGMRIRNRIVQEAAVGWKDWDVACFGADPYREHCRLAGPTGEPIDDTMALASVLPMLLMTERVDPAMVIGAIGKSLSGCAAKVVTALTMLICLPFAIFALVTGNWQGGAISIGIVVFLAVVAFQVVRVKFRNRIRSGLADAGLDAQQDGGAAPPVAGPLGKGRRRKQLDQLLQRCGLPSIAMVEPEFRDAFKLD